MELRQPVPQARVYNDANISHATSSTAQALTFNSERYDIGDLHSTSVNTGRLTAPVPGLYDIGASIEFAANVTGFRSLALRLNGTTILAGQVVMAVTVAAVAHRIQVATQYQLVTGDYVEVVANQSSGAALNILASGNYSPEFWMVRLAGFESQAFTG
jgi:hypothetical protein